VVIRQRAAIFPSGITVAPRTCASHPDLQYTDYLAIAVDYVGAERGCLLWGKSIFGAQ
jgi:hypothetical protein